MSYPFNYPTPTNADVQIFSEPAASNANGTWVKPQGASFVWFTLIGAGGGGASTDSATQGYGGGSGAVTNCMVPAFLIPDFLQVKVGFGGAGGAPAGNNGASGGSTVVSYQQKAGTAYTLISADYGKGGSVGGTGAGGNAVASNYFSCMGFYQSVAGQASNGTIITASATTFLSAGSSASSGTETVNYGYTSSRNGFFQISPIIVGAAGIGPSGIAGIGCGGGGGDASTLGQPGGRGGNGLCVIITW
jgi:hypothetical protein